MRIFCSGIGGIGLSAYASLQHAAGNQVSGSDRGESAVVAALREQGIPVTLTQDGSGIPASTDLFVYSEAIPSDAPERRKAAALGIPQVSYFRALGDLSRPYRLIAVCGTHGKSSTTAMAAKILVDAGLDPTVVVGTRVPDLGGKNWRRGESGLFLVEACEYRRSFHALSPAVALMTTVDGDHFDAYADLTEYQQAFADFLQLLPPDGAVITHAGSDADCRRIAHQSARTVIDADVLPLPELSIPGLHMRQNAQLVLALARFLGVDDARVLTSLRAYRGSWRRLEHKGAWRGVPVYDDYGHHPKEIRATLAALRELFPQGRIVCVFQPHTHERTLSFYNEFLSAFGDADTVIVPNIYEARKDIERERVDVRQFVADLRAHGVEAVFGESLPAAAGLLQSPGFLSAERGDVLLCLGAGDITNLAGQMITAQ